MFQCHDHFLADVAATAASEILLNHRVIHK